jgi:hypothetical protein
MLPLAVSVRPDDIGGNLDDLPQWAVGTVVVHAAPVIRAFLVQHAQADQPAELVPQVSLQDYIARRLRLVEAWLLVADYPQGQCEPARPAEELLAYLAYIQRRVPHGRSLISI